MSGRFYSAVVNDDEVAVSRQERDAIDQFACRIAEVYENAPEAVKERGADWYTGTARAFAERVADDCGLSFKVAAAIVAACSPRTRWSVQVRNTTAMVKHLLDGGSPETAPAGALFVRERTKAAAILDGDMTALRGPKVEPFYRNICGDESVVTIDVWAVRVALGDSQADEETIGYWIRGRRRIILEAAYHQAADWLGVSVAAVQAVTWVAVRGSAD